MEGITLQLVKPAAQHRLFRKMPGRPAGRGATPTSLANAMLALILKPLHKENLGSGESQVDFDLNLCVS
jgi:hypothetical protein